MRYKIRITDDKQLSKEEIAQEYADLRQKYFSLIESFNQKMGEK